MDFIDIVCVSSSSITVRKMYGNAEWNDNDSSKKKSSFIIEKINKEHQIKSLYNIKTKSNKDSLKTKPEFTYF